MSGNFSRKMIIVFCLTLLLGFVSFDFINPIILPRKVSETKQLKTEKDISSQKALKELEENKLKCVPVDKNLKYQYIKEEKEKNKNVENEKEIVLPQRTKLLLKKIDLEKKLGSKKSLSKELKEKYEKQIVEIEKQMEVFYKYGYETDLESEKNLLYREVCKEIK